MVNHFQTLLTIQLATLHSGAKDMWAAGCVMAECYLGQALFRGNSSAEMLTKIADCVGAAGGVPDDMVGGELRHAH
jgi:hypothetical protein